MAPADAGTLATDGVTVTRLAASGVDEPATGASETVSGCEEFAPDARELEPADDTGSDGKAAAPSEDETAPPEEEPGLAELAEPDGEPEVGRREDPWLDLVEERCPAPDELVEPAPDELVEPVAPDDPVVSATATVGTAAIAAPMPNATASAPIRPM